MTAAQMENPGWRAGVHRVESEQSRLPQYSHDPVATFKAAHGGKFTPSGQAQRSDCPACKGKHGTLVVSESDGWLRVHCFRCAASREEILAAVGLKLSDVGPPRSWPESPEERRRARKAIREAGWAAALPVVALEARVALLAARELHANGRLDVDDGKRLALAVERLAGVAVVFVEVRR